MRRELGGARRVGTGRAHHPLGGAARGGAQRLYREIEAGLPAADQLQVDRRQELGVEAGAVLGALGEIDGEAAAERVEARRRARKALARQHHGVDEGDLERRLAAARELRVDELEIELGVVDHQGIAGDEGQELLGDRREERLALQHLGGDAVDRDGLRRDVALGIDGVVEDAAGGHVIDELDAGDLDQPMPRIGIEAGGLGIENDFAHG